MKRNVFDILIQWDKQYDGKPLYLTGAPGVGKTYLSLELAKNFHETYLYLNPQTDRRLRDALLELSQLEQPDFASFLSLYYQVPEEWLREFLIILDDFDTYEALLELVEKIAKGTYAFRFILSARLIPSDVITSQCHVVHVPPMEFDEYLQAIGSEWYTEIIRGHFQTKKKIPDIVHKEMQSLFRDYLRIGGMPSSINEFLNSDRIDNVSGIQRNIIQLCLSRLSQFDESNCIRMNQLYTSIPEQLNKENKKYQYNRIRKGATHNQYKEALQMLQSLQLVNKIERADFNFANGSELDYHIHDNQFRLYPNDCGILYTQLVSEYPINILEEAGEDGRSSSDDFYQLLIETYFLQLLVNRRIDSVFWESGSLSKIDFIIKYDNCILPIELKYNDNKRSKSMSVFRNKYGLERYLRFSMENFYEGSNFITCPIYSSFCL